MARDERHLPINSTAACFFEPSTSNLDLTDDRWTLSAKPSFTSGCSPNRHNIQTIGICHRRVRPTIAPASANEKLIQHSVRTSII
jgi:hypothetical protein